MKNWRVFNTKKITITMIIIGFIVNVFTGCATTYHGVEISNVRNVREIYIRNAGTTHWGTNMAGNLQNLEKSRFSERVDIRPESV